MYLGIDYSSLTMKTCLSRCLRPKGQFVLYIMEQGSPCSKECFAQRSFKTYQSVHNGFVAEVDACKQL